MIRRVARRLLTYPVFGLPDVGLGDLALGLGLSAFGVALAAGLVDAHNPRGDVVGCTAVLLMTAPVVFARRAPLAAAAALAFGAVVNSVLVGHLVRCGAALPAVFFVAFAIGLRCTRRKAVVGMALLAVNILCQGYSDPQLASAKAASGQPAVLNAFAILMIMLPIAIGFAVAGLLLRRRNEVVARLRARNEELREQRERNARLMVEVDRAGVATEFDSYLHDRVGQIAAIARKGGDELSSSPDAAREAFKEIQEIGRAALVHMRNVVGNLREDAPMRPQPVLSELDRLLGGITRADVRLRTEGDPRLLPPGVELSGYRIVERALLALANDPASRVDVVVEFRPDSLQLTVVGPSARAAEVRAALGAARERAALHGGTLRSEAQGAFRKTVVQLPIVAGHA